MFLVHFLSVLLFFFQEQCHQNHKYTLLLVKFQVKEYDKNNIYLTNYEYDANNNLVEIEDNQGNIISYAYDTLGRKTGLIDPDLGSWSYNYDNAGNLIKQTDAKNNQISMNYDELSRVISKLTSSTINFYYDEGTIGTISRIESPVEITYYNYDNRLRKIKQRKLIDGIEFTSEWTYDSMDRISSKKLPDGTIITYDYNDRGGLESISDVITSMGYNENNMVTDRTYANSISTVFNYDPINYMLLNIKTDDMQDLGYSYDYVGNILTKEDLINNNQESMDYDDRNQLVKVEKEDMDDGIIYNISYSYDTIGNLLSLISNLYNLTLNYSAHAPILIRSSRINSDSSFILYLTQGWNLISAPLKSDGSTVSATFDDTDKIFTYDNINKKWVEVDGSSIIDLTKGYWINSDDGIIELRGITDNQPINLYEGRNLIGYPSLSEKSVDVVFNDINNSLINVLNYENDKWYSYSPLKSQNSLEIMKSGYGYWIDVNESTTLIIS
jgi:YD repeat-containing protein